MVFKNAVGKCKSADHVVTTAIVACSTNNGETMRSVIRIASDDSCGGGLGTRLQVMHERSRICTCEIGDLELIKTKNNDAVGPAKQ